MIFGVYPSLLQTKPRNKSSDRTSLGNHSHSTYFFFSLYDTDPMPVLNLGPQFPFPSDNGEDGESKPVT